MAKYTITHPCGHEHTYQICGPVRDRDRKEQWLSEQQCPRCRMASQRTGWQQLTTVTACAMSDHIQVSYDGTHPGIVAILRAHGYSHTCATWDRPDAYQREYTQDNLRDLYDHLSALIAAGATLRGGLDMDKLAVRVGVSVPDLGLTTP